MGRTARWAAPAEQCAKIKIWPEDQVKKTARAKCKLDASFCCHLFNGLITATRCSGLITWFCSHVRQDEWFNRACGPSPAMMEWVQIASEAGGLSNEVMI